MSPLKKKKLATEAVSERDLVVDPPDDDLKIIALKMIKELKESREKVMKEMYKQTGNTNNNMEDLQRNKKNSVAGKFNN